MFKLENFKKNKYLVNRCTPYLEIPLRNITEEYGVKNITIDKELVKKALSKCQHISSVND